MEGRGRLGSRQYRGNADGAAGRLERLSSAVADLDDHDVRNWALMVDKVHEHDALAGIELSAGSYISGYDSRLPARGITNIVSEVLWMGGIYEMNKDQIRELQRDYVAAAKRGRAAGFDIINIHGAEASAFPSMF